MIQAVRKELELKISCSDYSRLPPDEGEFLIIPEAVVRKAGAGNRNWYIQARCQQQKKRFKIAAITGGESGGTEVLPVNCSGILLEECCRELQQKAAGMELQTSRPIPEICQAQEKIYPDRRLLIKVFCSIIVIQLLALAGTMIYAAKVKSDNTCGKCRQYEQNIRKLRNLVKELDADTAQTDDEARYDKLLHR